MTIDPSICRYGTKTASYRWHPANESQMIIYDLKNNPMVGTALKVGDIACVICEISKKNNYFEYMRGTVVGFNFTSNYGPKVKIIFPDDEKVIEEVSVCSICDWNERNQRAPELYLVK